MSLDALRQRTLAALRSTVPPDARVATLAVAADGGCNRWSWETATSYCGTPLNARGARVFGEPGIAVARSER